MCSLKLKWAVYNHFILFFLVRGRHHRCIFHFPDPLPILHVSSKMTTADLKYPQKKFIRLTRFKSSKGFWFLFFPSSRLKGFLVCWFSPPLLSSAVYFFVEVDEGGGRKKKKFSALNPHFFSIICQQPSLTQQQVHRLQLWAGHCPCCARERRVSSLCYPAVPPWKCQILQPKFTDKLYTPSSLWHHWQHWFLCC